MVQTQGHTNVKTRTSYNDIFDFFINTFLFFFVVEINEND